jgi:hypothetical protein
MFKDAREVYKQGGAKALQDAVKDAEPVELLSIPSTVLGEMDGRTKENQLDPERCA